MDKQNGSYPFNWILFSNKNKWNANPCYKVGDPWKLNSQWNEAVTEAIYFMISFTWNTQKRYSDQKQIGGCQGLVVREEWGVTVELVWCFFEGS